MIEWNNIFKTFEKGGRRIHAVEGLSWASGVGDFFRHLRQKRQRQEHAAHDDRRHDDADGRPDCRERPRSLCLVAMARELDLGGRFDHYPAELSIGQQQRVAMARASVKDPDIILADEPTGNLDRENGSIVVERLLAGAAAGKTVIAATHDEHLLERAHHKLRLTDGRGEGVE